MIRGLDLLKADSRDGHCQTGAQAKQLGKIEGKKKKKKTKKSR